MGRDESGMGRGIRVAVAMALLSGLPLSIASAGPAADALEEQARETWRESIVRTAVPDEGCFYASYPSAAWTKVACTAAPEKPYVPRKSAGAQTVGDGTDYAAEVTGKMSSSVGTFPTVTGVTSEKDGGESNVYSLQLNSNFMSTAACGGISGCLSWQQFVYSSSEEAAFMQYWLIDHGRCPSGWNTFETSCWKNSSAVSVPTIAISKLSGLKLSGTAVSGGNDTLVFTSGTEAFSTSGKDTVVDLATDWSESEFNIIGDGGGSEAVFNSGSSITVKIAVTNGTTNTPTCASNAGTTGETNNLTLGSCTASGGSTPSITFKESN
jgi:hypothetical protein